MPPPDVPPSPDTDRNLLFSVLALQVPNPADASVPALEKLVEVMTFRLVWSDLAGFFQKAAPRS